MKTQLDIKSALIGLGIGILDMLGIAAASPPGPVGRYQVAGTGNHGLIIDTATGRVWHGFFPSSSGNTDPDFYTPKIDAK